MTIFRRLIFRFGSRLLRPRILENFDRLVEKRHLSLEERITQQNKKLRLMIEHCYSNVPYYTELFEKLGLTPSDIKTGEDLKKLPILSKNDIKSSFDKFIPINIATIKYINGATGGSTGIPLKYRMSVEDIDLGVAELYFDWAEAGYELGDKVAILAGGSIVGKETTFLKRVKGWLKNHRNYSSYGLTDVLLEFYLKDMIQWNMDFLRGYPTAIYRMAKYIEGSDRSYEFSLKAIITTAEMLQPNHRSCIERVFKAPVFDTYGLGDGGISAYECKLHEGLHINMDRAILEVVNHEGVGVYESQGTILATSLINYSMPFLRYDSGDLGVYSSRPCSCGGSRPILKKILGRTTDIMNIGGTTIGGPMITILMQQVHAALYRFIQVGEYVVEVIIVKDADYSDWDENYILTSMQSQIDGIELVFIYVNDIPVNGDEKFKIVVNNYN